MSYVNISPEQVESLHKEQELNILDVREVYEFAQGKIPGSVNIPLGFLMQRLNELDKSKEYIVVCRSGNRSSLACQLLSGQGFNVKNMDGGLLSWMGDLD